MEFISTLQSGLQSWHDERSPLVVAIQIGLLPDMPWDRFQFLGNTAVKGAYLALLDKRSRRRIRDIAAAFEKHDVLIAEVGRWCNLMDGDDAKRDGPLPVLPR